MTSIEITQRTLRAAWLCAGILGTAVTAAHAAPPPQIAQCAGCHQANGMGNAIAGFPALAGQPTAYLEQQLYAFKHGTRRNGIMKGFATSLSAADRKAIAAYYNALPVTSPAPAATHAPTPADASAATLAINGADVGTDHAIPACTSCHGAGGLGVAPEFPRLAGQPAAYLEAQLNDWKSGSRNETNLHLMRNVAVLLSPAQIKALAAYFAALPPSGK